MQCSIAAITLSQVDAGSGGFNRRRAVMANRIVTLWCRSAGGPSDVIARTMAADRPRLGQQAGRDRAGAGKWRVCRKVRLRLHAAGCRRGYTGLSTQSVVDAVRDFALPSASPTPAVAAIRRRDRRLRN
jgi:hypothetical protein